MKVDLTNYSYSILRYIHDTTTGEFINVGIVFYSGKDNFGVAKCLTSTSRIKGIFPTANVSFIKNTLKSLQRDINSKFQLTKGDLPFTTIKSSQDLANFVLPINDSSFQWSDTKQGRCLDVQKESDRLFERLISRYDSHHEQSKKTDETIWRSFSKELRKQNIDQYFSPKVISTPDITIKFKHAVKNGILHCVEPVSFDLSSPENIQAKACKLIGELSGLADKKDLFKVYMLIAEPNDSSLKESFNKAQNLLKKSPVEVAFYCEEDQENLVNYLSEVIEHHECAIN